MLLRITCIDQVVSPNGRLLATAVNRSCGATTGFRTILSIATQKRFLANGVTIADVPQQSRVTIEWDDDNHLRFACSGCGSIDAVKTVLDGSELYVTLGPDRSQTN